QAAVAQQLQPLFVGLPECGVVAQLLLNVEAEVGVFALRAAAGDLDILPAEFLCLRLRRLGPRDYPLFGRRVQGDVAPSAEPPAGLLAAVGVGTRGVLAGAGQRGRLGEGQLRGGLVEEAFGRGVDAVGARAEVGDVEVTLQDLVLGVL